MNWLNGLPNMSGLEGTEAALESERLAQGEPWCTTHLAGLQFYAYGQADELNGKRVIPLPGDRLHLVREPANPHDANAVQVWWKNNHMLGHLPRSVSQEIAPMLDAGAAARAYVAQPGDGEAWSLRALIVGPATAPFHERHIQFVANAALASSEREMKRRTRLDRRAQRSVDFNAAKRRARLRQAVETLFRAPFEPDLPAAGETVSTWRLMDALQCPDTVIVRIGATVGLDIPRFRYSYANVVVTEEFLEALRAWCQAPRGRIDPGHMYVPQLYAERAAEAYYE